MTETGEMVDATSQLQYSRLSPIRESDYASLNRNKPSLTKDALLVNYQTEGERFSPSCSSKKVSPVPTVVSSATPCSPAQPLNASQGSHTVSPYHSTAQLKGLRRLRLDLKPSRPLSPISSSDETTPTESPAQRPRFLQIPQISVLTRFTKTFHVNPTAVTPTPSPSEYKPIFEAESPDELALVEAAFGYNCKLVKRTPQFVRISIPGLFSFEVEVEYSQ